MKRYFFIFILFVSFFNCSRVDFPEVDATNDVIHQGETQTPGTCQVDEDCPDSGTCKMGVCVKLDPQVENDTQENETNEDTTDVSDQETEDVDSSEEVEAEYYSAETNEECDDDNDCDDNDPCTDDTCDNGECLSTVVTNCCNTNADCEAGEKCYDNACYEVPNPCDSDEDCIDEEVDTECAEGYENIVYRYIPFCNTAYGEGLGQCEFVKDVQKCDVACQDGKCVECDTDNDCDDNDPCTNDICVTECYHISIKNCCQSDVDCNGYAEECVDNECVLNLPSCDEDKDCDDNNLCSDDYCVDGGCFHITKMWCCQSDQECEKGSSCEDNVCIQDLDCNNDSDCNDDDDCTDDTCQSGMCAYTSNEKCTWDCSTDEHCKDSKYGPYCVYQACQPCLTSENGPGKGCGEMNKCYWTMGLDPEGYEVPVNKCYEEECFLTSDCPDKDPVCEDGLKKKFIPSCNIGVCEYEEKFVQCDSFCHQGECIGCLTVDDCNFESACLDEVKCEEKTCKYTLAADCCESDDECGDGEVCQDNKCEVEQDIPNEGVYCEITCSESGYAPIVWVADKKLNKDEEINPYEFQVELCGLCSWGGPIFHFNCKNGGSYGYGINAEVKCYNNGKAVEVEKNSLGSGKAEVIFSKNDVDCKSCF